MCDRQDLNPSCVFHGNLKGVIEEDSPLCPGEVSVFFHTSENATFGFPIFYYTLHARICRTLLSQKPLVSWVGSYVVQLPPWESYPSPWQSWCVLQDHLSASASDSVTGKETFISIFNYFKFISILSIIHSNYSCNTRCWPIYLECFWTICKVKGILWHFKKVHFYLDDKTRSPQGQFRSCSGAFDRTTLGETLSSLIFVH